MPPPSWRISMAERYISLSAFLVVVHAIRICADPNGTCQYFGALSISLSSITTSGPLIILPFSSIVTAYIFVDKVFSI
ncbi:MAG: hypothetical protein HY606_05970 [Planctomycetes bacterium]|nr:hypothetical protein [Planctomycetota bacterium]